MIDKDIEFCKKQISIQESKVAAAQNIMDHAKFNYDMATAAVDAVKKEKARVGDIYKVEAKKFRREEGILNEMRGHLKRLEKDKRFLATQHKYVEEGEKHDK